jgi:hypothetical protein
MSRSLRYVVLHHTGVAEPHFDFMLATDDAGPLMTWRLPRWPMEVGDVALPLPAHRRAYLDYEGPVSGNRGEVRRVAAGQAELIEKTSVTLTVRLDDATALVLPMTS